MTRNEAFAHMYHTDFLMTQQNCKSLYRRLQGTLSSIKIINMTINNS